MSVNTNIIKLLLSPALRGIVLGITLALLEHGYRVIANSRTVSRSQESWG